MATLRNALNNSWIQSSISNLSLSSSLQPSNWNRVTTCGSCLYTWKYHFLHTNILFHYLISCLLFRVDSFRFSRITIISLKPWQFYVLLSKFYASTFWYLIALASIFSKTINNSDDSGLLLLVLPLMG